LDHRKRILKNSLPRRNRRSDLTSNLIFNLIEFRRRDKRMRECRSRVLISRGKERERERGREGRPLGSPLWRDCRISAKRFVAIARGPPTEHLSVSVYT